MGTVKKNHPVETLLQTVDEEKGKDGDWYNVERHYEEEKTNTTVEEKPNTTEEEKPNTSMEEKEEIANNATKKANKTWVTNSFQPHSDYIDQLLPSTLVEVEGPC